MRSPARLAASVLLSAWVMTGTALAFTYVTSRQDARRIVHPPGYDGTGGELTVTFGLHPDFAEFEDEVAFSAEHVVAIWTSLLVSENNLEPSLEIPRLGGTDFFGTLIHEFGHTLGLAHPNLAPTGTMGRGTGKFAATTPGPNGEPDLDAGEDGIRGSADDERGDDVNAVHFRKADNDPFTLPESGVIDSTTYSRNPEDLPAGDRSPNVSSREVAAELFSLPSTESMMVGGGSLRRGQVRRGLGADDVAGIRYAMSGLDEVQGTSDDYTLSLEYVGVSADADVILRFDKPSGFASAGIRTRPLNETHKAMARKRIITYNPDPRGNRKWFFPQPEPVTAERETLNARAVSLTFATKPGVRYGVSWPEDALEDDEEASEILLRVDGEDRSPLSGRLFLFIAEEETTEVQIAFPSKAPDGAEIDAFELTAREAD